MLSHPGPEGHNHRSWFATLRRGIFFPELHSDQGTSFRSQVAADVCRLFLIQKIRPIPSHAQSDRFIGRRFRALGCCLLAACRETKWQWDELLPLILKSYCANTQASMAVTPNMMMLGHWHYLDPDNLLGAARA